MKGLFKKGICTVMCVLMLALTMTTGISMVQKPVTAHAAVSTSEKKKIQAFIEKYCIDYLEHCCYLGQTGKEFKFDSKKKTDIAFSSIACKDYMFDRLLAYTDLCDKYGAYTGVATYDATVKKKLSASGKKIFGNSFKISLAIGKNTKSFYPLSSDKKYIAYNRCDKGDWSSDHNYSSISNKNGTYTVKIKYISGWWDDDSRVNEVTDYFTVTLKKSGSSFVIKNITSSK